MATWATTATLSLAAGVAALALIATSAILASRWAWVERLLGALDRVYLTHKWMAVSALGLASYHLVFKAGLDAWEVASIIEVTKYWVRLVRQLSFVALMFIVLLALNRKIPYHLWRGWHKLSGPLFVLVVLHWLTIKSPIALSDPAGLWLGVLSALGVAAAAYRLLLYPFFANHQDYEVVDVSRVRGAVRMRLAPVAGGLDFKPGQFGFLRFKEEGMREPHPFTIASASREDGAVEFFIRGLGDFTRKLVAESRVGMRAEIYAPHGHFSRPDQAGREVWVAGGVDISPTSSSVNVNPTRFIFRVLKGSLRSGLLPVLYRSLDDWVCREPALIIGRDEVRSSFCATRCAHRRDESSPASRLGSMPSRRRGCRWSRRSRSRSRHHRRALDE